jgi:UDP-glucose 4-epimerase
VTVIDDLSTGCKTNLPADADIRICSITDKAQVEKVFAEQQFDIVSHHAAQISVKESGDNPQRDAEINCIGWLNVLDSAAKHGCRRIVFASSGGTLYGDVRVPAREFAPLKPRSPYGITKLAGEQYLEVYARKYRMETAALRYGNVYGPRQNPHGEAGVVAIFCQKTLRGQPITVYGNGTHVRDYVYVDDVVNANVLAMTSQNILSGETAPINVGTGVGTYVSIIAHIVQREVVTQFPCTPPNEVHYAPERPDDLKSSMLNPVWAYDKINWRPTTKVPEGIQKTVAWFGAANEPTQS